jgi:L-alanine-DL-glutamate epimerase-like enolase superfamily enzyme
LVIGLSALIKRVEIHTVRIPLPHVVFLGEIRIAAREFAVAVVESSDGLRGWGHTFTRGAPVAHVARQCFAPLLLGEEANLTGYLWNKMARAASIDGAEAFAMRAISILDIALWDLKARRANLPLYELLGGVTRRVPVLVPCGYRREDDSSYGLKNELQHYRDAGITAVKTMFTPPQLKAQAALINQARTVLGKDIMLGNDFFATAVNAAELLRALDEVTDAKLDFVEDPLALSNRQEFAAFRQNWKGGLVTGETVSTLTAARDLCQSGWISAARFDATVCGGVTAWMQMNALAVAQQQAVWPHCFPEIHAHLAAATGAPFVESPLPTYETVNFAAVLASPLPIAGGFYELPNRPGLGLDLNEEKLQAFRTNES